MGQKLGTDSRAEGSSAGVARVGGTTAGAIRKARPAGRAPRLDGSAGLGIRPVDRRSRRGASPWLMTRDEVAAARGLDAGGQALDDGADTGCRDHGRDDGVEPVGDRACVATYQASPAPNRWRVSAGAPGLRARRVEGGHDRRAGRVRRTRRRAGPTARRPPSRKSPRHRDGAGAARTAAFGLRPPTPLALAAAPPSAPKSSKRRPSTGPSWVRKPPSRNWSCASTMSVKGPVSSVPPPSTKRVSAAAPSSRSR